MIFHDIPMILGRIHSIKNREKRTFAKLTHVMFIMFEHHHHVILSAIFHRFYNYLFIKSIVVGFYGTQKNLDIGKKNLRRINLIIVTSYRSLVSQTTIFSWYFWLSLITIILSITKLVVPVLSPEPIDIHIDILLVVWHLRVTVKLSTFGNETFRSSNVDTFTECFFFFFFSVAIPNVSLGERYSLI